jgi:hypothetical protein
MGKGEGVITDVGERNSANIHHERIASTIVRDQIATFLRWTVI